MDILIQNIPITMTRDSYGFYHMNGEQIRGLISEQLSLHCDKLIKGIKKEIERDMKRE